MLVIIIWPRGCTEYRELWSVCLSQSHSLLIYSLWHQKAKWETEVEITKKLVRVWNEGLSSNWNSLKKEWPHQGPWDFCCQRWWNRTDDHLIKLCWMRRERLEQMTSKVSTLRFLICLSFLRTRFWSSERGSWVRGRGNGQAPPVHLSPLLTQAAQPRRPARHVQAVALRTAAGYSTGPQLTEHRSDSPWFQLQT